MLKFYYSTGTDPSLIPTNEGVADVTRLLEELDMPGVPVEMVDVAELTEKERTDAYLDAVGVSVIKKYRIRQVFGSRRISGTSFGKNVPALIIINLEAGKPEEVYPRQEPGRIVPIAAFLRAYLGELSKHKLAA
ncbi:MAG: hypothetical protein OSB07_06655 [Dehalococcoidia bacterium]|nr:hypothetical protein [Dehalococcoidia bacterium]